MPWKATGGSRCRVSGQLDVLTRLYDVGSVRDVWLAHRSRGVECIGFRVLGCFRMFKPGGSVRTVRRELRGGVKQAALQQVGTLFTSMNELAVHADPNSVAFPMLVSHGGCHSLSLVPGLCYLNWWFRHFGA